MKKPSITSSLVFIAIAIFIFLARPSIVNSLKSPSGGGFSAEISAANDAAKLAGTIDVFGGLFLLIGIGLLVIHFMQLKAYKNDNQ